MRLVETLQQSHSQLRQIIETLLSSTETQHQSIYFEQLWQQFLVHEHAEEYIAYRVMNDEILQNSQVNDRNLDYAVMEHHYFEDFVEHIALLPELSPERPKLIHELIQQLESHMQYEEAYIFPRFGEQLSEAQNEQMVTIYLDKCREYNKKYIKGMSISEALSA